MYIHANPNPYGSYVGDCVIRAISIATNQSWDYVYLTVCIQGFMEKNMPNANSVWGNYLKSIGFRRFNLPDNCPDCYTVRRFCYDNPYGIFILATGSHVIAVIDGNYYDAWDSGDEVPVAVWRSEET